VLQIQVLCDKTSQGTVDIVACFKQCFTVCACPGTLKIDFHYAVRTRSANYSILAFVTSRLSARSTATSFRLWRTFQMEQSGTGVRQRRSGATGGPKDGIAPVKPSPALASKNGKVHTMNDHAPAGRPGESRFGSGIVFLCMFVGFAAVIAPVRYLDEIAKLHRKYDRNNADGLEPMSLFSAETAMRHIEVIAKTPRWTGSEALDRSLEYTLGKIEGMVEIARSNGMLLEVESFTSNGSYACSTGPVKVVISYNNVLSVVARISPIPLEGPEKDPDLDSGNSQSLLVNAHIDSFLGSPGASDNVVGVGIALESLRSIASMSQKADRLSRPIVFLFNGAEEPLLAGAHGFMSSHRRKLMAI
jgi:Peptidase family M28